MYHIEKLNQQHVVQHFDCGTEALNVFLQRHALQNQSAHSAQTYVGLKVDHIIGYYSLSAAEVEFQEAPERMKKGLARHPVPCLLMGRLAVEMHHHGMGVGKGLVKDACKKTLLAADIAGVRALVVHAKNNEAKQFYQRLGFVDGFINPLHLYVLTKELLRIVSS